MKTQPHALNPLFAAALLALTACGGGSSSDPPARNTDATVSGVVADGPLQGATACYDLNDNSACDAGEPVSAATPADGGFSIVISAADAGRHQVVVVVPATAIDADTGRPVGAPLTLVAPATGASGSQSVFVSPLTTMVAGQMRATGATATEAAAVIQAEAGLNLSPLESFIGSSAAQQEAALVARLAVQTQIALANAMAPQVGQTAASGLTITQADVDSASTQALRNALPAIATSAAAVAASNPTDVAAALATAAQTLVATQEPLDPDQALLVATAAKLGPGSVQLGQAAATLRGLRWENANNWRLRYMAANAADNTPDAQGLLRFYDVYRAANAGNVIEWYHNSNEARRGDLHWNGSVWRDCSPGLRSTQTQRDAQGRNNYDFCDGFERGVGTRSVLEVSGQTMAAVIANVIRRTPGSDSGVNFADWGPADLSVLGGATFPAGSEAYFQTATPTYNAPAYDVTAPVRTFGAEADAGGDARNNSTLPCLAAFNGAITSFNVGTLEQLVANNRGLPCIVNPQTDGNGSSLDPNRWWGATSVSIGTVAGAQTRPAGTGTFYTADANLRVSFSGANGVSFYSCYTRTSSGSPRNCTGIGSGTYSIQTLGDARVMSFANLPPLAQQLTFSRVFVERGGTVYFGFRSATNVQRATVRLNLPAANALLGQLGIAPIVP